MSSYCRKYWLAYAQRWITTEKIIIKRLSLPFYIYIYSIMDFATQMKQAIQKYLPEALREKAGQFTIPIEFIEKMPELIILVLNSKSMDKTEEKQSWFNLLPLMNEEQIAKLKDILTREKDKLAEIEKKYEEKKLEIKKKYLTKRQTMGYVKKMEDIKSLEAANSATEQAEADAMLANI